MKTKYLLVFLLPLLISSCGRRNSPTSTSQQSSDSIDVSFVALNDFHGVVEPRNKKEVGLKKIAKYLKDKKSEGAVLLNSGDSYQGTFISGYDKGITVSKVFKDIDFDAYTIGNHEFDWGIDTIKQTETELGKKFLGANIYTYPGKEKCSDLGQSYTIKTINEGTNNEIKVGIIGVIGEDQITSIVSTVAANYTFVDPTPIVKDLANELRSQKGCNIVVADYHASNMQVNSDEVSKYVDAVFLAHTHQQTYDEVNGVPFIQGGRYGEAVSEITLTVNKKDKTVTNKSHKIQNLSSLNLEDDSKATEIIDAQKKITDPIGNVVIGTSPSYMSTEDMSCYYSKISYEKAVNLGYNVDFVLFNSARYYLDGGQFNYSALYETNPFKNKLYILSTNGYTIYRETAKFKRQMGYNPNEINISDLESQKSTWYEVLVYDYNGLHINLDESGNKYYDYFAASFSGAEKHTPTLLDGLDAFELALESLQKNPTITTSDYSGNKFINYTN